MNPKQKKATRAFNLDDFEFDPSGFDIKWSKNLITVFDGYRIHRCIDITFIEKAVAQGELPREFVKQWRVIRTVLHKFASVGPEVPNVEEWMKRRQLIMFAYLITISLALPAVTFTWIFNIQSIAWFTYPFALIASAIGCAGWTASKTYDRKVAWAIARHMEENPNLFNRQKEHLKDWVQKLIRHTARIIRKEKLDRDDHPIKFYNEDYSGIIVEKRPSGLRKNYVMKLKGPITDWRKISD